MSPFTNFRTINVNIQNGTTTTLFTASARCLVGFVRTSPHGGGLQTEGIRQLGGLNATNNFYSQNGATLNAYTTIGKSGDEFEYFSNAASDFQGVLYVMEIPDQA